MKKFLNKYKEDICIFLIPFFILIIIFLIYYPGIISYDGINQWGQVQTGKISNAHPFFSTYFMYLLSKIWNSSEIVLIFQILVFSLIWTYICHHTRNGNLIRQIIYTFIVCLVPIISIFSISLWKDILYSYYLIMLSFVTYQYGKKNFELRKSNCIVIGILLFLVSSYRHNGIIVAFLYLVIITFLYFKNNKDKICVDKLKKISLIYVTLIVLNILLFIPKNIHLDNTADSEYMGTINQQITWMFGSYLQDGVVNEKDKEFLDNILETDYWKEHYNGYLINDTFLPDYVDDDFVLKNQDKYRKLFFKYVLKNPIPLIKHYLKADALLYSVNSIDKGYIYVFSFSEWGELGFDSITETKLPKLEKIYTKFINITFEKPFKYFYQPGLILFICIGLLFVLNFKYKIKNTYLLCLSMFLNTISLLPINLAQDLRYVYINYLTLAVLGIIIISQIKVKKEKNTIPINRVDNKKMKVCYILPHFYPHVGGAEQAFMDLITVLVDKKINVRVVTSSSGGEVGYKSYNGIDIYYYNWPMFFGHPIVNAKDLKEHIEWADIVHSAVYSPVPPVSKMCRKLHKPHVCSVHEVLGNRWYWIESNKIKALLFKKYEEYTVKQHCDLFVTPSFSTKKDLEECNKKANVQNIYWISEQEKRTVEKDKDKFRDFFGINNQDIVFLNYGRPGKTKGVFVYLDAIKMVVKNISPEKLKKIKFCFIMAKDPKTEREKFLAQVKEHNLEDIVIIRESVSRNDLEIYRECADYVVVPSITEGFGLTAIEACEAGKKLIYSSGGSLPEVTFGQVLEFENRNSKDLAEKLEEIILGKIKFKKKNKKDFTKETISKQYIKVYKKVIEEYGND